MSLDFFIKSILKLVLLVIVICFPIKLAAQSETDTLWSFSKIRTDDDGDLQPDYLGENVTITGIANIGTGLFHEHYLQVFLQNDSAGLSVFNTNIDTPFEVGDSLVVSGKIEKYNGLTEVHASSYQVFKNVADEPTAKSLTNAIQNPTRYLGMLVEGSGHVVDKGSTFNGKYLRISPSDTDENMMIYVSKFHRNYDDFNFGLLRNGDEIWVKGIITEDNPDFPNERIFKLYLRTPNDLEYIGIPIFYLYLIFGFAGLFVVVVITWIVMLKRKVNSKTTEIRTSLQEKEVLLREIHHRVKNSLAIVSGLIELQLDETDSKEAKNVLYSSQSRIKSVALIHDKLYRTESLANVDLDNYIQELVEEIHATFSEYKDAVKLNFDLDAIEFDTDRVIPCGLLINELVVNAYKHAFQKETQGQLSIRLKDQGNNILLEISDNGPGLSDNFKADSEGNLGTMLIQSFSDKLDAEMEISHSEAGTAFYFVFPKEA